MSFIFNWFSFIILNNKCRLVQQQYYSLYFYKDATQTTPTLISIEFDHLKYNINLHFFQTARLIVDRCQSADITELEDGSPAEFDISDCQSQGSVPPFNEQLNVNTPLQIGGMYTQPLNASNFGWSGMPGGIGFEGCIRNIYHNSKVRKFFDYKLLACII